MSRRFPVKFVRNLAPARVRSSAVRISCERLEDRTAPALFSVQAPQTPVGINNNGYVGSGDWDGNGIRDIVVTNYGDGSAAGAPNNITFLYGQDDGSGNGNGKFLSPTTLSVGGSNNSVSFLAVDDLNEDGNLDIVTCQTDQTNQNGSITVFLGSPVGAFTMAPGYPKSSGGSRPAWVGTAKLNADSRPDVVVVNLGETVGATERNFVTFLGDPASTQGNLTNTFTVAMAAADGVPTAAAIAKIGTDAVPDIAVTFANVPPDDLSPQVNGSVKVYTGNGDGSFDAASAANYDSGGPLPICVVAAEIDGSPGVDLVVASAGDPDNLNAYANFGKNRAVAYLRNAGNGSFGPTTPLTLPTSLVSAFAVAVADFNQDSKQDIAICDLGKPDTLFGGGTPGAVYVYTDKTSGGFGYVIDANSPYSTTRSGAQYLVVDNFNANPSPDIVVVHESNAIVTLLNTTAALAASTTTLTAAPNPSDYGQTVTLTAKVTGTGTPSGTVTFFDNGVQIGTAQTLADVSGVMTATLGWSAFAAGAHPLTAKYGGDGSFSASTSNTVSQQVNPAATTTTLTGTAGPVTYGTNVTFTATVSSAAGAPTGTVNFFEGATQIGSGTIATVGGNQVATYSTTGLVVGSHDVVAKYVASGNFAASTSNSFNVQVNQATTTITVSSAPNPSSFSQSVTLSATVASAGGAATGTVNFFDNGVQIGSGGLSTVGGQQVATFSTTSLALGDHPITAQYVASTNFAGSTSAPVTHTVTPIVTGTTVVAAPSPSQLTQTVTFTATVSAVVGAATGTVNFFDGGSMIGSGPIATVGGNQVATFSTGGLALGGHTITATYVASGNFAGSTSSPITHTVNPITTTVTVSGSPNPATVTQTVTFTAAVGSAFGAATGSVDFYEGANLLGTGTITTVGGQQVATYGTAGLTLGSHTITAKYTGTAGYAASQADAPTLQVNPITTTVTLVAAPSPSLFTQTVTLTATAAAAFGAATGTVDFYDGTTLIGSDGLSTVSGQQVATFATGSLALGGHTLTAKYAATGNFAADDSDPVSHTVNPAGTTVTVVSDDLNSDPGQSVTFTATVVGQAGTPTGTVNFFDGGTQIGSGTIATVGGQQVATYTTASLASGPHTITAAYPGATGYTGSTSPPITQTVASAGTTISFTFTPAGPVFGDTVTFSAAVSSASGAPTGTVNFFADGALIGSGGLSTVGGQQVATFATASLAVGTHTVQAKYAGAGGFAAVDSAPQSVTVARVPTTVTLGSSNTATLVYQPVTFTATVGAASGTPTGTVTFLDNGTSIGTGSLATIGGQQVATFTTSSLAAGSHPITARFEQSGNFAESTSSVVTQQVSGGLTTVSVVSTLPTALFTQPVTFTATLSSPAATPTGTVNFLDGSTVLGTGTVATVGGQQVATFTTSALTIGTHTITASYPGAGAAPAGFGVLTQTVTPVPTTAALTAAPATSFLGRPVTLTATVGVPAGVTASPGGLVTFRVGASVLGSAPVSGGAATVVTSALPAGTNTVTATYEGDAATLTSAATAVVTVSDQPPPVLIGEREFGVGAGAGFPGIARFFNPDATERYSTAVFPGFSGGVRVTSADFNGDGVADLVAGSGPGVASLVLILDGKTKAELFRINPYEATFLGGVYVASSDLTGDGVPDLMISPDEGGGPRVRVFSGAGFGQIADFFGIEDPDFRGGARVAAGDVTGDGVADLVVSAGFLGGPRIAGFDGLSLAPGRTPLHVFADFFIYEPALRNGAFLAVGDLDGDGRAEVIGGGGPGGGPRVRALSGADLVAANVQTEVANFFGGDVTNRGGIRLVARNLDGDQFADLVTGDGTGAGSRVTGYLGKSIRSASPPETFHFDAFPGFDGGVYVG